MKKIIVRRGNESPLEVFSPVFGPEEKDALLEMLPKGAKIKEIKTTDEKVGGGFCFLFRQDGWERRII
jgi:hypothetical protein